MKQTKVLLTLWLTIAATGVYERRPHCQGDAGATACIE